MSFTIHIEPYERAELDDRENCATTALLRISLDGRVLTRNNDVLARSVRNDVRVAVYPLARWFAANYWRLCYESLQPPNATSVEWRLAHELAAAGEGFEWPFVTFAADGEDVHIWSIAVRDERQRVAQYLENTRGPVPLAEFQREIGRFVKEVVDRLDAVEMNGTDLDRLWSFIQEENADPDAKRYRIVEARLGYDPDRADEKLVEKYVDEAAIVGESAVDEIAAVYNSRDPSTAFDNLSRWIQAEGRAGRVEFPNLGTERKARRGDAPWQRGYALAQAARSRIGLNGSYVSNRRLAEWWGMSESSALSPPTHAAPPMLSLASREGEGGKVIVAPTRKNPWARRFELARLLCDHATADPAEKWLPATNGPTARQKEQRAFAAEFLCPIEGLRLFLDGEYLDEERRTEACEHFGVQESVVLQQLVNHHDLPRSILGEDLEGSLPYTF